MNNPKLQKVTKSALNSRIRDLSSQTVEILGPITLDNLPSLTAQLRRAASENSFITIAILPPGNSQW